LPPLKDRGSDILLLADYFTKKYSDLLGKKIERISTPAIDMLLAYHWPGNVRELENVIERAVIVASGDCINGHDLPPTLQMKDLSQAESGSGLLKTWLKHTKRSFSPRP
jgi:Nif-specific regulatory protein